ncbi:MAG: hypothetical protein EOP52_11110 [Sphingobacteriales bacterium]|nr:MAG: hypothetical protein EOP52_11110 [Sphingobacteriales bacterium]
MKTYKVRWRQVDKKTGEVIDKGWELVKANTTVLAESRYKRVHKNHEVVFVMPQTDKPDKPNNYYN